jgi:cation transport regulator ChaC
MSYAFHRRLKFRRTFWQRVWDFRVTASNEGFWATVWQAVNAAWQDDFQ